MEDLYDDLENYNDVNLVNELRTENAELKQKLGECLSSMDTLQKDFDKLAADFKILETNYSSLLKIARAEIKRKSDMITNLNVEKDMLVLKQFKPEERKKKFNVNNVQNLDRGKKRNSRSNTKNLQQSELNCKESDCLPSEASSTTTDKSNRLTIVENRNVRKHNENHIEDVFPDRSCDYHNERFMDRRVSMLTSHQFTKFSSDEEFEDMYSALEPKPPSKESSLRDEPERGRKRMRDDPHNARAHYETFTSSREKYPSYETLKDRYNKNRTSRHYENDRNINRDQYDSPHSHRNKSSPERYRRSKRDYGDDRHAQHRERPRRLPSPPRDRYRHKSRERRPYPDREGVDHKADMHKYSQADTHIVKPNIHGEYDEPLNKRPRVEHYPRPAVDRRQSDRQFVEDQHPTEMGDYISCQSPDNLHSEHMPSNEPVREIRSTAVTTLEDPRVSSGKYLRCTDGNKDILCTLSSNKVNLQPVNKALWELVKDKPQEPLTCRPSEISSELVNEIYMDIDNPLPNLALDSKEGTDVTDYLDEGLIEYDAAENNAPQGAKNENKEKSKKKSKLVKDGSNEEEKVHKVTKCKITRVKKADKLDITDEPSAKSSSKTDKADKSTHRSKHIESNLKHNEVLDKNDESVKIHKTSKSTEGKEKSTSLPDIQTSKTVANVTIQREFEHKVYSIRHIVEGDLELSDETNDEIQVELKAEEQVNQKKHRTRKKSQRDSSKEKPDAVNTRKTRSKKDKEVKPSIKFSELFGDSSSLISPEELALATAQAHAQADGRVPECEDAQDGLHTDNAQHRTPMLTHTEVSQADNNIIPNTNSSTESLKEEKKKTKAFKDVKTRTHHSKHKKFEHTLTPNESVKDPKEDKSRITHTSKETVDSVLASSEPTVKEPKERTDKEISSADKPAKKSKGDEETKELTNKKTNSNEDKTLLQTTDPTEKCFSNQNATKNEYKKSLSTSENKENANYKDASKEKKYGDSMPHFFNDTLVPNETISFTSNKANEENVILKPKETICAARLEEIPNLVPDKEESGLVKTVVISTGIQPSDPNLCQLSTTESLYTPLKALATSTSAKELSLSNTFDQSASNVIVNCVNGKTTENGQSQNETDVPDVRINYYRRRRKVLKKSITG